MLGQGDEGMNFVFSYGYGVVNLPRDAVLRNLPQLSGDCMKVLFALAAQPELCLQTETKYSALASVCALTELQAETAIQQLAEAGILVPAVYENAKEPTPRLSVLPHGASSAAAASTVAAGTARPKKSRLPAYRNEEVARLLQQNGELPPLLDMAQKLLGKVFSEYETASLVALYDYFGFDAHYILTLLAYLVKKEKTSMRYIEATAAGLYDDGIRTVGALEERFAYLDRVEILENKVRRLFGLGTRALSTKERKYLDDWTQWNISDALLTYAFEQTVEHTTRPTLAYMHKILKKAYDAGITTEEEARAQNEAFRSGKAEAEARKHSFAASAFLDAALARSYGTGQPEAQSAVQAAEVGKEDIP